MNIENYISVTETEGPRFAADLERQVRSYDVDIINLQRAEKLVSGDSGDLIEIRLVSGAVAPAES